MSTGSVLQTFNQQASDMLTDLGRVFPNDVWLGRASRLLNAAVAMNERSWLPALAFMNGEPPEKWSSVERRFFEMPAEHMTGLMHEVSEQNKDVVRRYMHNLATMCNRLKDQAAELNSAVSSMRQGDAYGSVLDMIGGLSDNPGQLLSQLTSQQGQLEGLAESLAQNPEIASMVGEVAGQMDLTKVVGMLPALGGLQGTGVEK